MNDTKIIQSIKQKDEEAIAYLMAKYSGLLWKVAGSILDQIGSDADIEEVVADVYIHIWRAPDGFDHSRSSLKNYLCVICKSKAIDRFRILCRNAAEDIDKLSLSQTLGLEEMMIQKEELQKIFEAIKRLPSEEQSVVIRRYLYNQRPRMIAKATGLSVRRVENISYRAKIKIRSSLANEE